MGTDGPSPSKTEDMPGTAADNRDQALPWLVILESNIAGGKSTCIEQLKTAKDLFCQREPVTQWECLKTGFNKEVNLLGKYYQDPQKHIFELQELIRLTFLEVLQQKPFTEAPIHARICERCLFSCEVFIEAGGYLTEIQAAIIEKWQKFLWEEKLEGVGKIRPDLIIFLAVRPQVCLQRVRRRNRPGEGQIDLSYLTQLEHEYEKWLGGMLARGVRVEIISGELHPVEVAEKVEKIVRSLGSSRQQ
jgi:deoxyadenosine/deoxycytidine kinase